MARQFVEQVLKTIRNYGMLKRGDRVLAAVSGGPDSVFLLHALIRLKNKIGLGAITACTMDHGLRGMESKADLQFVKKLCASLGIPCLHATISLKEKRSDGLSTEEAARDARYRFFRNAAAKVNANVIATGHTLDDQAETVLMRIIKGASLKGASGIAPVREDGKLRIVRPLIELEKREISSFLDHAHMPYRVDRSNLQPVFFRNIVRLEVMPFLERYNPRLKRALFNLAEHLREDREFIDSARAAVKSKARGCQIAIKDIAVQPKAIQKEILRDMLEQAGGEVKKLSFRHWKEMENLISSGHKGNAVHLPGGIALVRSDRAISFGRI